jgi:hypothetical protein
MILVERIIDRQHSNLSNAAFKAHEYTGVDHFLHISSSDNAQVEGICGPLTLSRDSHYDGIRKMSSVPACTVATPKQTLTMPFAEPETTR